MGYIGGARGALGMVGIRAMSGWVGSKMAAEIGGVDGVGMVDGVGGESEVGGF